MQQSSNQLMLIRSHKMNTCDAVNRCLVFILLAANQDDYTLISFSSDGHNYDNDHGFKLQTNKWTNLSNLNFLFTAKYLQI